MNITYSYENAIFSISGRPNEFVVGLNEAYYRARITGDETPGLSLIKLGTEKSTKVVL